MDIDSYDNFINYYDILEISPQANMHEVEDAYRRIKTIYTPRNPDIFKTFNIDELQLLLMMIEEAYATIGNPKTRELYNAQFFERHPHLQTDKQNLETPSDKIASQANTKKELPKGFSRTPLSCYPVDETFEVIISNQDYFDGQFLCKVRKYKQVQLEEFGKYTCIAVKYLYAIESDNYDALPARVFVQGYLQQYCKVLGLDSQKVITSYMTLYENGKS